VNKIQLFKKIKLFAYDFDGVMTDNRVYLSEKGIETVKLNRADGLAIIELTKRGYKQIIISTETNKVVKMRAKKLKIEAFIGVKNKEDYLKKYCKKNKIKLSEVCFVGNDVNDIGAIKVSQFSFCPKDSHLSVKKICNKVININGGDGVIREMLDLIFYKK
tara:strand:- start:425 stop:907 length:483 start_codon:yes stop_codon:yes gene_type:complete